MDVVDLAQARERTASGKIEAGVRLPVCPHRGAETQQRPALVRRRARDPGAYGVDDMQLDHLAGCTGSRRATRDIGAELFDCGHAVPMGDDHSTSLPYSFTATIAETMALSCSSQRPTRRL